MSRPLIIGHRGAAAHAPENTRASFRLAAALGAQGFETDLRVTADGQFILLHDARLNRTTNGRGPVEELRMADIQRLDAGCWFEKSFTGEAVPTLDEALALARKLHLRLYLEIKAALDDSLLRELATRLHGARKKVRIVVLSFDPAVIAAFRRADLHLETALLVDRARAAVKRAQQAGATHLAPRYTCATPALIRQARQAGLGVLVWTVNRRGAMRKMFALEVDGIMTDDPGCLRELLQLIEREQSALTKIA